MREEYFNIGEYGAMYDDIDRISAHDIDKINGDNLFLAFLKEDNETDLCIVAAIDEHIYNFSTHKYISPNTDILYARSFSDIMPSNIWRLVHIVNYDLVSIDIDDYKSYLFENFEKFYKGKIDKNAKETILRHGFITKNYARMELLNKNNLEAIDGSNIFLAILENIYKDNDIYNSFYDKEHMMEITYEGVNHLSKLLKDMIESKNLILPDEVSIEEWLENFTNQAIDDLDWFWYLKINSNLISAHFIASINGNVYDFCADEFVDFNKTEINYAESLDNIIPREKWSLSYDGSGKVNCLLIDDSVVDVLAGFQIINGETIDKNAKSKVLRNGYQFKS